MRQVMLTRSTDLIRQRSSCVRGFTLVEILIVVVILGILAAMVIPQFVSANSSARESATAMNVHRIQQAIGIYQQQHESTYPSLANFTDQMTLASNVAGDTAIPGTDGFPLGPYTLEIPINPWTGTNDVSNTERGTSAWHYDETTGDFRDNHLPPTND